LIRWLFGPQYGILPDMAAETITTAEQLFQFPGLGACELLRGELVMMSPAGSKHGRIALRIGGILSSFVELQGLGVVLGAETGFRIAENPDTVRAPDVAFIRRERVGAELPDGFFPGAPDLAVEVLSPNDRAGEVLAKVQDWLGAGSAAVWVADPKTQTVMVYGADRKAVLLTASESIAGGDLLPGFSASVAGFFAM
jgi:Uma2 family endonuclease